jgi:N-methylhydantoinase A
MTRILIPRYPGVLCALGLLMADVTREFSHSFILELTPTPEMSLLLKEAAQIFIDASTRQIEMTEAATLHFAYDLRYHGQAYELSIPTAPQQSGDILRHTAAFHAAHEMTYGYALEERAVELVNMRLRISIATKKPSIHPEPLTPMTLTGSAFQRETLHPGARFSGEALVYQVDATTYVAPGWTAQVDAYRNLILERVESQG